ncbi:FAD-dependent oxidoreductase, partial [Psychrobacter sp. C 20.9]
LTEPFKDKIRLDSQIEKVVRAPGKVTLYFADHSHEEFEHVIFACHSDQALALLGEDASAQEREILGAIPYRDHEVVLHTDTALLP